MKCDDCEHMKFHDGGIIKKLDDISFHYCEKEHWEFDESDFGEIMDENINESIDVWSDCNDYKEKIK